MGRLLRSHRREEFTLSSKVGRLLLPCPPEEVNGLFFVHTPQVKFVYDYSYDAVMRSYEESLRRLGLDRIDILFVHDVDGFCHGGREARRPGSGAAAGRRLARARRAASRGEVSAIGVGVNEWEPCATMLELADPDLFLLAGRYTLLEQAPLETLFSAVRAARRGYRHRRPLQLRHPGREAPPTTTRRAADIATRCARSTRHVSRHGVPLTRAALQFVLAHPLVVSVIPGAQTRAENLQNVAELEQPSPAALWAELRSAGSSTRAPRRPESGGLVGSMSNATRGRRTPAGRLARRDAGRTHLDRYAGAGSTHGARGLGDQRCAPVPRRPDAVPRAPCTCLTETWLEAGAGFSTVRRRRPHPFIAPRDTGEPCH